MAGLGIAALAFGGCETVDSGPPASNYLIELGGYNNPRKDPLQSIRGVAYWDGDAASGSPSIVVDLRKQEARFFKGDTLVGISPISSGTEGRDTPAGQYKILQKKEDHHSTSYGRIVNVATGETVNGDATPKSPVPPGCKYEAAPMPYFMRLTWDGVGMHEGFLPGYPASHGCIRMDGDMVRKFFANTEVGTPVTVVR